MSTLKLLEKHVIEQVRNYLRARGWRLVKTQVVAGPGYSVGEPGCADYLALHYQPNSVAIALWLEFKGPHDKRRCTCAPLEKKVCKVCRQKAWHARERARGAVVWVVSDLMEFIREYERGYSWLHSGESGRGQLDLLAGAATAPLDLDESTPHRSDDWLRALGWQDSLHEEAILAKEVRELLEGK